ncbi:hypothetical protein ACFL5D_04370 [Candidatus Neomarinimicrobiota bacterium]
MTKNIVIPNNGFYYRNNFWFHPAYSSLNKASRDLLQCFLTELDRIRLKNSRRKDWIITNNGEISFTALQFKKLCGYQRQTYINARNQLIKNGIIIQTYRGGNCKGDMATYKLLCTDDVKTADQHWRSFPEKDYTNDIPKLNKNRIGNKTQWPKGVCGRILKSTLSEYTLIKSIDPNIIDTKK